MADVKNFSSYLADARAKYGVQKPNVISAANFTPPKNTQKKSEGGQDPLSWFIDILSRPMRAVLNPINVAATEAKKRATEGANYDFFGGLGNQLAAPFTGFGSSDPQFQPTGSDIIENVTDAVGLNTNPYYRDEKDNVNPIGKGIGGFVIDVAADPLTYVPGGIALSLGRGAIKGGQAVRKGVQVAENIAKTDQVAGKAGAEAVAATESVSKPFASNVIAGMLKGAAQGVPNTSVIGRFSKELKPVGLAEWRQRRAYDKVFKAGKRLGISAEDLIEVAKNPTFAAKAVTESTKNIDIEKLLSVSQRVNKSATKAEAWGKKFSDLGKLPEALAPETLRTAEAVRKASESSTVSAETVAQRGSVEDAKTFADSILTRQAATEAPTPTQTVDINAWLGAQVAKADTAGTHTVAHGAARVGNRQIPAGRIKNAELRSLAKLYEIKNGRLVPIAGVDYDVAKLVDLNAKIEVAYAKYLDDFAQASSEAGKVKASRKIMDLITGQPEQARLAFGDDALKILEGTREDVRANAVKYLAEALSNIDSPDVVTKFDNTVRARFTKAVFQHLGVNIPGTAAREIPKSVIPNDPTNLEASAMAKAGETLRDHPDLAGMSLEEVRLVANGWTRWGDEFLDPDGFPYTLENGVLKAKPAIGEGRAKWEKQINTPDQVNLGNTLLKPELDKIKKENELAVRRGKPKDIVAAENRATRVLNVLINRARLTLGWMNTKGYTGVLGLNDNAVHLYIDQVYDVLYAAAKNADAAGNKKPLTTLLAVIGNTETSIPLGNQLNVVLAKLLNPAITKDELFDILAAPIVLKAPGAKMPPNILNLTADKRKRFGHNTSKVRPTAPDGSYFGYVRNGNKGYYRVVKDPQALGNAFIDLVDSAADDLQGVIKSNNDNMVSRMTSETHFLSDEAWDSLTKATSDLDSLVESLDILANPAKYLDEMGRANKTVPEAVRNAINLMKMRASAVWQTAAVRTLENARVADIPVNPKKTAKQNAADSAEAHAKNTTKQGKRLMQDAAAQEAQYADDVYGEPLTEFEQYEQVFNRGIANALNVTFNRGLGIEDILHNFESGNAAFTMARAPFQRELGKLSEKYSRQIPGTQTSVLSRAWYDWANNIDTDETLEAKKEIERLMDRVLGPSGPDQMKLSAFNGIPINAIEASLIRSGSSFEIDYDLVEKWAKYEKTSLEVAFLKHFKEMVGDVESPLDLMDSLHYAAANTNMLRAAAGMFANIPGAKSDGALKGFSRISEDVNPFDNPLIYFLPKDTHINNEIIGQVSKLEKIMASSRLPDGDIGKFVTDTYTAPLAAWKGAVTIMRPGHHLRNTGAGYIAQWGDLGSKNLNVSQKDAGKILLATRGKDSGFDPLAYLTKLGELDGKTVLEEMPKAGDILIKKPNKNLSDLSVNMVNDAAFKNGLYTPPALNEDLTIGGKKNWFARFIETATLQKTKAGDVARWASQTQNDFTRLAYFMQFVRNEAPKGYWKNWDDLFAAAAENARRVNPDGSMLTIRESRYGRLLIPFYAWNRLMLPQVLGMIADNPGRFMILPKASYNLAVSLGVDPQSLQNPFPDDQLFPEFVKSQLLGPVFTINGKYFSLAPGFSQVDVLETFFGDPGAELPGMVSPFIRIPAELMSGSKWGSQSKIKDLSDYVDSNLPLVNYLSNFTGASTTGSLLSLLQGKGLDPQYQVFRENKGFGEQLASVGSWVSGLTVSNLSQDNLVNYAELEKMRKAGEQSPDSKNPF